LAAPEPLWPDDRRYEAFYNFLDWRAHVSATEILAPLVSWRDSWSFFPFNAAAKPAQMAI
jgi:hypothetical protein